MQHLTKYGNYIINRAIKHLAQTIKALSDPIRLRIILLLQSDGELCVCDLIAVLNCHSPLYLATLPTSNVVAWLISVVMGYGCFTR